MKIHKKLTYRVIEAAVRENMVGLGNIGFCTACGAEADGVEPDARGYTCECCGEARVYGAEELLFVIA